MRNISQMRVTENTCARWYSSSKAPMPNSHMYSRRANVHARAGVSRV